MRYLGVSRAELFSPQMVCHDAAIFSAVADELVKLGHTVICMSEQEVVSNGIPRQIDGIFQMARSSEALSIIEQSNISTTNTVAAVKNCGRVTQTLLLQDSGLIPTSLICRTDEFPNSWNSYPCWVKRGDTHAVIVNDVRYVSNAEECAMVWADMAQRGIDKCVIQEHVRGCLLKFYGVRGEGLTDCRAVSADGGKFGLERHNDSCGDKKLSEIVDLSCLTVAAEQAAQCLNIEVYGGDAVISHDGTISIIDMNDWPSFKSCTARAAVAIAKLIVSKSVE